MRDTEDREHFTEPGEKEKKEEGPRCDDINDPVRKGLCKVCGTPVLNMAPFCQDHDPPVP
jgi:hypothetical protein